MKVSAATSSLQTHTQAGITVNVHPEPGGSSSRPRHRAKSLSPGLGPPLLCVFITGNRTENPSPLITFTSDARSRGCVSAWESHCKSTVSDRPEMKTAAELHPKALHLSDAATRGRRLKERRLVVALQTGFASVVPPVGGANVQGKK